MDIDTQIQSLVNQLRAYCEEITPPNDLQAPAAVPHIIVHPDIEPFFEAIVKDESVYEELFKRFDPMQRQWLTWIRRFDRGDTVFWDIQSVRSLLLLSMCTSEGYTDWKPYFPYYDRYLVLAYSRDDAFMDFPPIRLGHYSLRG